jgi:hypothetical protein
MALTWGLDDPHWLIVWRNIPISLIDRVVIPKSTRSEKSAVFPHDCRFLSFS